MKKFMLLIIGCCFVPVSCTQPAPSKQAPVTWQQQLNNELPLLGHRNWILIVDKAFPAQSAPGIEVINTNDSLSSVLKYTLAKVQSSVHVKPIIYTDKELNYITEAQTPGINSYRGRLKTILGKLAVQSLLHDSVFVKMSTSSKLFKVLILKTNQTYAYSSAFIQLDCAYWDGNKEKQLRKAMQASN
jgi:hypothetical protein